MEVWFRSFSFLNGWFHVNLPGCIWLNDSISPTLKGISLTKPPFGGGRVRSLQFEKIYTKQMSVLGRNPLKKKESTMSNHHLLKMKLCEACFREEFFLSIYNWTFPLATLLKSSFGPTKIIGPSYEPFALL